MFFSKVEAQPRSGSTSSGLLERFKLFIAGGYRFPSAFVSLTEAAFEITVQKGDILRNLY